MDGMGLDGVKFALGLVHPLVERRLDWSSHILSGILPPGQGRARWNIICIFYFFCREIVRFDDDVIGGYVN